MDFVPENRILQLRHDSFQEIRKEYNLDKPGRMKEAIQLLHEWVQKQPHFKKKDFGLSPDSKLQWDVHSNSLAKRLSSAMPTYAMTTIRKLTDVMTARLQIYGPYTLYRIYLKSTNNAKIIDQLAKNIYYIHNRHQVALSSGNFYLEDPFYLESTLIASKGSLERAKTQLDKICTMRTLMPIYFGNFNVKTDFTDLYKVIKIAILPKLTPDHYRVSMTKYNNGSFGTSHILDYFKYHIILAEYLKTHDYLKGFILISDFSEANMMDFVSRINPMQLRETFRIFIEGYGMRIKSINIISPSKFVDVLVSILKQVVPQKIGDRIHVYKIIQDVQKMLPKEMLPKEYGGDERSIKDLSEEWIDILSSEEHMDRIANMNNACTDESCRQQDQFSEQYAGMPGSFRLLSVD